LRQQPAQESVQNFCRLARLIMIALCRYSIPFLNSKFAGLAGGFFSMAIKKPRDTSMHRRAFYKFH
jgi:hypothetical protein